MKSIYFDKDGIINKKGKVNLRKLLKALNMSVDYIETMVGKEWTKELRREIKEIEEHFE